MKRQLDVMAALYKSVVEIETKASRVELSVRRYEESNHFETVCEIQVDLVFYYSGIRKVDNLTRCSVRFSNGYKGNIDTIKNDLEIGAEKQLMTYIAFGTKEFLERESNK